MTAREVDAGAMLPVRFVPRARPLVPAAVVFTGDFVPGALARLSSLDQARLSRLEIVWTARAMLVVGAADSLPWAEGAGYLGVEPHAPALLLPTALEPDVPAALFERALLRKIAGTAHAARVNRWAISLEPLLLVPASAGRLLSHELLSQLRSRLASSGVAP